MPFRRGAGCVALAGALLAAAGSGAATPAASAATAKPKAHASFLWYEWFRSRPDLRPPKVKVLQTARNTAPGYVFLAAIPGIDQRGPMIVDNQGQLVWFKRLPRGVVPTDLRVQSYRGRPV